MAEYSFVAAILVGLMGSGHCLGMCGGVVGAFSQTQPQLQTLSQRFKMLFAYNSGRIGSYMLAGALVGGLAQALGAIFLVDNYLAILRLAAGLMLIAMGLYISKWLPFLAYLEQGARPLWQLLSPLRNKILPINTPNKAIIAGMLWGWLPCGLVYSTLTWALSSGSAIQGAMIMLGFGLGTLPALVAMGAAADKLSLLLRDNKLRLFSTVVLIAYGSQMAYIALNQIV